MRPVAAGKYKKLTSIIYYKMGNCARRQRNAGAEGDELIARQRHDIAVAHHALARSHVDMEEFETAHEQIKIAMEYDDTYLPARFDNMIYIRDIAQDPMKAIKEAKAIWDIDKNWMAPIFMAKIVPDLVKAVEIQKKNLPRTPVTILTGFLGSGKTTLLNRILAENHGHKIAVIENEFGAVGIDEKLVVMNEKIEGEGIIEIMNGCICCTVREDLATTL